MHTCMDGCMGNVYITMGNHPHRSHRLDWDQHNNVAAFLRRNCATSQVFPSPPLQPPLIHLWLKIGGWSRVLPHNPHKNSLEIVVGSTSGTMVPPCTSCVPQDLEISWATPQSSRKSGRSWSPERGPGTWTMAVGKHQRVWAIFLRFSIVQWPGGIHGTFTTANLTTYLEALDFVGFWVLHFQPNPHEWSLMPLVSTPDWLKAAFKFRLSL